MVLPREQEIYLIIIIGIIVVLVLVISLFMLYLFSNRYAMNQKIELQKEMIQAMVFAQDNERKRIASDLHDEIGSKLNIIFMYLQQLNKNENTNNETSNSIIEVTKIVNSAIENTRKLSHDLLPPIIEEFGIVEALNELCSSLNKLDSLEISFSSKSNQKFISDKKNHLNLFRIAQELIKNSITHGKASKINMHLYFLSPNLNFAYKDNGIGFKTNNISKGLGLKNIESRVQVMNGSWTFTSRPNKGFEAIIQIKQ